MSHLRNPRLWWILMFGGIAAAGLVFRLSVINESFWYDEAVSADRYFSLPFTEIVSIPAHPNNHPMYSLLVHAVWMIEVDEITARLPSLLAWGGLVASVFWIGRRVHSEAVGWAAAMLAVLAAWQLRFSIEARGYALAAFLGTLAIAALIVGLEEDRRRWLDGSALLLALASFAHLYAATLLAGVVTVWFVVRVRTLVELRRELLPLVRFGAAFGVALWLLYLPSQNLIRLAGSIVIRGEPSGSFALTTEQSLDLDYVGQLVAGQVGGTSSWFGIVVVVIPLLIALTVVRHNRLASAVVLLPLVVVVATFAFQFVYFTRFYIVVQPFVLIGVAIGIVSTASWLTRNARWAVAPVAAAMVVVATLGPPGGFPETLPMQLRDWDEAAAYVSAEDLPIVANPAIGGWSVVRDALGWYLPGPIAEPAAGEVAPGDQVFYVRLLGGAPDAATDTLSGPVRFGQVEVFRLLWTGEQLVDVVAK